MTMTSIKRVTVLLTVGAVTLAGCGGQKDEAGAPAPGAAATSAAPAGNGVADLEAAAILDRARAALDGAKSFHTEGEISSDGQTIALDLRIDGTDLVGDMSLDGAKVDLLVVGKEQYIRPDKKFWVMSSNGDTKTAEKIAAAMGDKWAKVPADDKSFDSLFTIANIDELLKSEGTVTKGETKEIEGTSAIALAQPGDDGKLWVATEGEPYPLRLEGPTAADGALNFSKFGETFSDLKKPAASEVVDFSKLRG